MQCQMHHLAKGKRERCRREARFSSSSLQACTTLTTVVVDDAEIHTVKRVLRASEWGKRMGFSSSLLRLEQNKWDVSGRTRHRKAQSTHLRGIFTMPFPSSKTCALAAAAKKRINPAGDPQVTPAD